MRPKVTILTEAKHIQILHCGECNWEQQIISNQNNPILCCPWCGWSDLKISSIKQTGAEQTINCEKHGDIVVAIPNKEIHPDDFMNNLFCPYCG
jgi:transcription elongation factor Elf1